MTYLDWNFHISNYFFNPEHGGSDVHLYFTKTDVIEIGKKFQGASSDDAIWKDFLIQIQNGLPNGTGQQSIIANAQFAFKKWKQEFNLNPDKPDIYPYYIAYLIFLVLPLTEGHFELHPRNYYDRLNSFLLINNFDEFIDSLKDFDQLWKDLEDWSFIKNGDLGFFLLQSLSDNWKYVGKPFSQCLLSPKSISKLPEVFFETGLVPFSTYAHETFKSILIKYGAGHLGLKESVIKLIKDNKNELGHSIVEIAKREYKKWTGDIYGNNDFSSTSKKSYTIATLFLQFEINEAIEKLEFSYRLYSSHDYPDDLNLDGFENLYEVRGWSKTIKLAFQENIVLYDHFNKWIAKSPVNPIQLFIDAGTIQLSNQYFIETNTLVKNRSMYLMCKIELAPKIQEWGHHFDNGDFEKLDLDGIPDGYVLFRFENPKISHAEIPLLQLNSQKSVQLVGGLRLGFRTFLNSYLPEVEVVNGTGNENVFIQFKHREEKIHLKKKHPTNYWLLPPDINLDSDFHIKIEGENTGSYDIAYNITTPENSTFLANADLPIRDSFGNVLKGSRSKYAVGNRPLGINKLLLYPYSMDFTSIFEDLASTFQNAEYTESEGNILLSLITLKKIMSTEDFYKAFELLHDNKFGAMEEDSTLNYSKIKRSSLNFYDYLGFIDYDYESKKLMITPAEVIFVPTNKGREVLLTGARDTAFVTSLLSKAQQLRLSVQTFNQHLYNQHLLLPDCIRIKTYGRATEGYGVKQLEEFARELKIGFDKDTIPQAGLLELSSTLAEYEDDILQNNEVNQGDYDWARRVFNIDTFAFEKNESLDTNFSLVEYKLNEYTVTYRLWNKGKCYKIDRNWGKYLALKHHKKQAILFDSNNNRLAIPVELPIPRLLAKSIFLLSGIAPVYSGIMFEGRKIGYRVYQNIPSIFIKNLFNKLNQKVIPTTLNSY